MNAKSLVPDTNSILHYPPLDQVDWCQLANNDRVKLVICMQVIHELDEKKSHPHLSERARRAIRDIRTALKQGRPIREGVDLHVFNHEVRREDYPDSLNPDAKDDRVICEVLEYRKQHALEEAAVVTDDLGMELRCEAHGIPVYHMDPGRRLPDPVDEVSRKYREVQAQLHASKERRPTLRVLTSVAGAEDPSDEPVIWELSPLGTLLEPTAEARLVREQYAPIGQTYGERTGLARQFGLPFREQRERYNAQLEGFYEKHAEWVKKYNKWLERGSASFTFGLWVDNGGTEPADDIDFDVAFPNIFSIVAEREGREAALIGPPAPPRPPESPRPAWESMLPRPPDFGLLPHMSSAGDLIRSAIMPRVEVEVSQSSLGAYQIRARIPRLKHHHALRVAEFDVEFRSRHDVTPFEAPYTITAANDPDVTRGKLVFLSRCVSALAPASPEG